MESLLSRTGQLDTLRRAGAWFLLAMLWQPACWFARRLGGPEILATLATAGFYVFVGVAMVLASRIRCPQCRTRWFFYAQSTQPAGAWLGWLKSFAACPKCGFSQAPDGPHR